MRASLIFGALALNLLVAPVAGQQARVTEGESHILSAFTSGADPGVLSSGVDIGPALRKELGGETDSRKIYDALVERTAGKQLRVELLTPGEVVRYASLPGVKAGEPLIRLEAGDVLLLFQYASKQKNVTFIEQLGKPAPRTAAPTPEPERLLLGGRRPPPRLLLS
jgi:hypothetical protein